MATLIFIWALISTPYDRMVCSMWISQAPSPASMRAAGCVWTPEQAQEFIWRAVERSTGRVACQRPVAELPEISCDLSPMDAYLIRVYEPAHVDQFCVATIVGAQGLAPLPTADDIEAQ